MTSVNLGMPAAPPPVLAPRRKTRQIKVGKVLVGGDAPVSVQSMTTTLTSDVNATLQQIAELTASGCDIVRVACPSQDDAEALPAIAQKSQIPVIADIHFQPSYVFAAIEAGCAAVRVNPGNIKKFDDQVKEIAARRQGPRHLDPDRRQRRVARPAAARRSTARRPPRRWSSPRSGRPSLFEEHDFHDFKISVKHNDPVVMVRAYEMLAEAGDWPLHLGVTEAGPAFQGTIKSVRRVRRPAVEGHRRHDPGLALRAAGRGGQGRPPDPGVAQPAARAGSRSSRAPRAAARRSTSTSSPRRSPPASTGSRCRCGSPSWAASSTVPGEAREADLGVASGNGKGQIFVKGEVIKTVPESQIVETLIEEAMRIAEEMEPVERQPRRPSPSADRPSQAAWPCCRCPARAPRSSARPTCPRSRALLARDPVVNVFADYRARTTQLQPRWLGGEVWGYYEDDRLLSACHSAANLVPAMATRRRAGRVRRPGARRRAGGAPRSLGPRRRRRGRCGSGSRREWPEPREVRRDQPHLEIDRTPLVAPDPLVPSRPWSELDIVYPACVAMYTEEVGVSPGGSTAAPRLYRARVAQLISRGWSFARLEDGRVVFKAEVAARHPARLPGPGRVRRPRPSRGGPRAPPGMAAVVELALRDIAPVVSLYVNDHNPAARAGLRAGRLPADGDVHHDHVLSLARAS